MALAVSAESQLGLFKSLFGKFDPVTLAVTDLIEKGAKIDNNLYVVKVMYQGQVHSQALTVGASALMKGSVSEVSVLQNKFMLKTFIEKIVGAKLGQAYDLPGYYHPSTDKPYGPQYKQNEVPSSLGSLLKKKLAEAHSGDPSMVAESIEAQVPLGKKSEVKSTNQAVKLVYALTLGQKVHGTSTGSVYRVIALNDRVKVAALIKGSDLSVRVECNNPSSEELKAVKTMVSWKGEYGSKHFSAGLVPVHKVLGAFLFSSQVEFDQMVHGSKDLEKIYG